MAELLGTLINQLTGRYYDAAYNGRLFHLNSGSVALAAAHASGGALATVKLVNGFFNPGNSGKLAVIRRAHVSTTSGTPAGGYFYNYINGVTIASATTGTVQSAYLQGGVPTAMLAAVNVVLAVSGGATTNLSILGLLGGPAAIAAGAGLYDAIDEVDGAIIVPPATIFGITALGAGTSHVVQSTLTWEEVPV